MVKPFFPGSVGPHGGPTPGQQPYPCLYLCHFSFGSDFKKADLNPAKVLHNGIVDSFKLLCGLSQLLLSLGNKVQSSPSVCGELSGRQKGPLKSQTGLNYKSHQRGMLRGPQREIVTEMQLFLSATF